MLALSNCGRDVRRQEGQIDDACNVGRADLLALRDRQYAVVLAVDQPCEPNVRLSEERDEPRTNPITSQTPSGHSFASRGWAQSTPIPAIPCCR
jgi:hypothetical protein